MIKEVIIKNFALMDEVRISFDFGLQIITGETGAGKSILINAMNALSTTRLPSDIIALGKEFAYVEVIFSNNNFVNKLLEENDVEIGDDLILSRKIYSNGKSVYKVNAEKVSKKLMKEVFEYLVDVHSQREHQSLLKKDQIDLVDSFLEEAGRKTLAQYKASFKELLDIDKKLTGELNAQVNERETDLLTYEIEEIERASLIIGEDEALELEYKKLSNSAHIIKTLMACYGALSENDMSINDAFATVVDSLDEISLYDENIKNIHSMSLEAQTILQDISRDINSYADSFDVDEYRLKEVTNRLSEINKLKNKYKTNTHGILNALSEKKERLDFIDSISRLTSTYLKRKEELTKEITKLAQSITKSRKEVASRLSSEIEAVLKDINLKDAKIEIVISEIDKFTAKGSNEATIMIRTNKNEDMKPIYNIASGGEMSRVMLAIKSATFKTSRHLSFIFDEIDSGISGKTAWKVAQKMQLLSKGGQIIAITHLPQIAAFGDNHYRITKDNTGEFVRTTINTVEGENTVLEIARLIGGNSINQRTLDASKDMLDQASDFKKRVENGI